MARVRAEAKLRAAKQVEYLPELRPVVLAWNLFNSTAKVAPKADGPPPPDPKIELIVLTDAARNSDASNKKEPKSSARTPATDASSSAAASSTGVRSSQCPPKMSAVPPAEPAKDNRLQEAKTLVDRILRILHSGRSQYKWIEVFELEEGFEPKLLESKKRTMALRLHPDKVDEEVAQYCGGHDRVKEAYHFMDQAYKNAKTWMVEAPPWDRPPWHRPRQQPQPAPHPKAYPASTFSSFPSQAAPRPPWQPEHRSAGPFTSPSSKPRPPATDGPETSRMAETFMRSSGKS